MPAVVVVVSDTSPVRALHHLARIDLFEKLYGRVVVPPAVERELLSGSRTSPPISVRGMAHVTVAAPTTRHSGIPSDLDAGESEAIALALELDARLLLIDERKGTNAARALGLNTIGVLGMLLEAKRGGHIQGVLPYVDRLKSELDFFVSPALRRYVADLAGE